MVKDAAALETVAADPAHWLITEHGLAVSVNFQEVDLNAPGGVDVEIPWSAEALPPSRAVRLDRIEIAADQPAGDGRVASSASASTSSQTAPSTA